MTRFVGQVICLTLVLHPALASSGVKRYDVHEHHMEEEDHRLPLVRLGVEKPPRPNSSVDSRTISGIDTNFNGVRDSAERELYDLLKPTKRLKEGDFEEVLRLAALITPHEPIQPRSLYHDEINCQYNKLPFYIRSRLSLPSLIDIMINNSKRKFAFKESSVLAGDHELIFTCK